MRLFSCVFIGEEKRAGGDWYQATTRSTICVLGGTDLVQVRAAKKEIWERYGLLTHSDAALWASKILENRTYGPLVRAEIARRFSASHC